MGDADATELLQPRARLDGPVILAEPDPAWPAQFAVQEARIRGALGPLARHVEHVGSTSIPGLAAKPVLDILLLVDDPANEATYVLALESAGYVLHLREPGWQQHRLLRGVDPAVNMHVFAPGSEEARRLVLFRDHLRAQPDDVALYERTKRQLAARTWAVTQDYADAKSGVVEEIIARASAAEPPGR
jgi:GrpB-like predicted nucleotidyltransferase (UPF0157 family)